MTLYPAPDYDEIPNAFAAALASNLVLFRSLISKGIDNDPRVAGKLGQAEKEVINVLSEQGFKLNGRRG